jgi:hypothetical protein
MIVDALVLLPIRARAGTDGRPRPTRPRCAVAPVEESLGAGQDLFDHRRFDRSSRVADERHELEPMPTLAITPQRLELAERRAPSMSRDPSTCETRDHHEQRETIEHRRRSCHERRRVTGKSPGASCTPRS